MVKKDVYTSGRAESRGKWGKYGGFKNTVNQEMFVEEEKEHPSFNKKQVRTIVLDHLVKKHGKKMVHSAVKEGRV
jgi:hypothetical protein